jgi:DNA-binding LacI/PurR family transcriptional regulator
MLFGRDRSAEKETFVDMDFSATMYKTLSYLSGLGHRKICFLNQSEETFNAGYGPVVRSHDAFSAYAEYFPVEGIRDFCAPDPAAGYRKTARILTDNPQTTAFVVMNDKILSGVIKAIEDSGREIPDDVSIVSLATSESTATMFLPPLTTLELEGTALMELAIGELIAKLEKTYFEVPQRLIPGTLVERKSSGPVPNV